MRKREAGQPRKCVKWKPRHSPVSQAAMRICHARIGGLKLSEGDTLLGEGVVVLLAGGDSLVHLSFVGSSMVAEGGGGEASLFLRHDLKRQGAFFFFGHGHIAFVIVVKETLKTPSARASP